MRDNERIRSRRADLVSAPVVDNTPLIQLENKNYKLAAKLAKADEEQEQLQRELERARAEASIAAFRITEAEQRMKEAEEKQKIAEAGLSEDERNVWQRRLRTTVMEMLTVDRDDDPPKDDVPEDKPDKA